MITREQAENLRKLCRPGSSTHERDVAALCDTIIELYDRLKEADRAMRTAFPPNEDWSKEAEW